MTATQYRKIDTKHYTAHGGALAMFKSLASEILIEGPAGCVGGETELWDPVARVGRRIEELCESKTRPWVLTTEGPVLAEAPFRKGFAPLYRVELCSGESCVATADHLFLSESGWLPVSALAPGMKLRSVSRVDAPHSWQTAAGSTERCSTDPRRCGPRTLGESAVSRASSPSGSDAHGRSRADWPGGGPASGSASSPTCPASARPSTPDSAIQSWAEPFEATPEAATATLDAQCRDGSGTLEHASGSRRQRRPQSPLASHPQEPFGLPGRDSANTETPDHASQLSQPCAEYRARWEPIKSLVYERLDWYYDLHVPGPENYVAQGIVSHNTGKTFAVLQKVHMLCEVYPGIRVLFIRKTLKSLRESVLVTWETEVLGEGHKAITGTATRAHRDSYTFENKSHIVLAGIDTPSRHMSTQFDVVCIFEAVECSEDDLEYLLTRCRNWKMPFQQLICDTNPRQPGHWLNKRANRLARQPDDERLPKPKPNQRQMVRVKSKHEDNPFLYDQEKKEWTIPGVDYMGKLSGLHGPRLAWFRDGEWRQAEGLVIPQWDTAVNIVDWPEVPELGWYAAAMDFGFHAAGCFQVWGFTGAQDRPIAEQRGYRVAEVYRRGWTIEQWAQVVMEVRQDFPFRVGVADSADPGSIKFLNDYLGSARGRGHAGTFRGADKSKGIASGLELLRSVIANEPAREENGIMYPGGPRLYVVRDAFPYGLQPELRAEGREACFEDEIESLVFPDNDGTREVKEIPDKACADHAIDPARYVWTWAFGKDQTAKEDPYTPKPGTYGELFGTPQSLLRASLAKVFKRGSRRGR